MADRKDVTLRLDVETLRRLERMLAQAENEGLLAQSSWGGGPGRVLQAHLLRVAIEAGLPRVLPLLRRGISMPNGPDDIRRSVQLDERQIREIQQVMAEAHQQGFRLPGRSRPRVVKFRHVLRLALREGMPDVIPRLRAMRPAFERQLAQQAAG